MDNFMISTVRHILHVCKYAIILIERCHINRKYDDSCKLTLSRDKKKREKERRETHEKRGNMVMFDEASRM